MDLHSPSQRGFEIVNNIANELSMASKTQNNLISYCEMIVRLSLLRKTILIPEYLAFMCVCVFVDGCISQF